MAIFLVGRWAKLSFRPFDLEIGTYRRGL